MKEKNSTDQIMRYAGIGLVIGAAGGMLIGMVLGLEKVGEGLLFGALIGIVLGPAVGALKKSASRKK